MACAVATISGIKNNTAGKYKETERLVTFTSYDTGGCAATARQFGCTRIKSVRYAGIIAGFAAGYAHCDPLVQTDGSLLIRLRAAAGTEAASGAGSAAVTARVVVVGQ